MNYHEKCLPQVHMDRTRLAYRKLGGTDGTGVCMGLAPFNVQVLELSAQAAAWPQLWYACGLSCGGYTEGMLLPGSFTGYVWFSSRGV